MSSDDKLLVLINPRSGPGRAYQVFRKQVAPVLSDRGVEYDVVITQRANHAHDLMVSLELHKYRAVAVVAGDGLLHEVYNGLGMRDDWQTAMSFPVCIIPGGSGNGLAKSLAYWRKDPEEKKSKARGLIAALNLVRGSPQPIDLVMIHTHSGQRYFSFLSFGLGLLTDIDIESERMRFLGEARFTVWAIAKVVATKRYSVTISFKRATGVRRPGCNKKSASQSDLPSHFTTDDVRPPLQHSISCHPRHPESPSSSCSSDGSDSPPTVHAPDMEEVELGHDALDESFWVREKKTSTRKADYSHLLGEGGLGACDDPLSQPVPDDWETINGEFLLVYVVYQSHISSSVFMVPDATPDDGVMWLILMQGSMNRADIAKVLLQLESGEYTVVPGVLLIPVTELRLVPHDSKALFTIDGESVPYGPVHARVLPGLGRVLVR
ncbi:Diacylglycerol kinase catalytic domain [Trinorchestia longiramus]|nr:Diacylglycerol kinase catalytic domain [Trinorchestia longiramus]